MWKEVKLLGITIDEKLKFDKHVNIICKTTARQINVMYQFKCVFDLKERQIICNTFILSNFNVLFCTITCIKKIEGIQERALWFMYTNKTSTYRSLLEKSNTPTLHLRCIKAIRCIKTIASEVFKSLNNLNPNSINKMFQVKGNTYDLRDSDILCQTQFNKITYDNEI